MPKNKRRPPKFLVVLLLILIALAAWRFYKKDLPIFNQNSSSSSRQEAEKKPERVRLIAVGDTFAAETLNKVAKQSDGSYDYLQFMSGMKPFFDKADIKFCNQPVPAAGSDFGISGYPSFNSPTEFSRDLKKLGCNLINLGSNHSFDKGQAAINATVDYWKTLPGVLAIVGVNKSVAEQKNIPVFEMHGLKFAVLSYTTYTNNPPLNSYGVNIYSNEVAKSQLAEAKTKADFVIVSMRWGTEYSPNINSSQDKIAQSLADNGADIVLGHGTHVLQPVKVLDGQDGKKVPVWFGLGNFLNAQVPVETLFNGIAVVDIDISTKKLSLSYLPVYMHYEWSAQQKASEDLLSRRSFMMYTLNQAAEPLSRSQNNTTVETQRERITTTLNKFTAVKILRDQDY